MFKNITVPYDGSDFSRRAFKAALELAKKHSSRLTVITCIQEYYSSSWYVDSRTSDLDFKKQYKAAKSELAGLEADAERSGVPFASVILKSSYVAKTIIDYAKSHKTDLIVIGSHGRRGLDRLFLGSVANAVLQRAGCPILVTR